MGDEKEDSADGVEGEKEVSVDGGGDEKEDGEKEEEAVVRDGEKEESGEENGDALNLIGGVEPIFLEFNCAKLLADFFTWPSLPNLFFTFSLYVLTLN